MDLLEVGKITNTHGLRGEVKIVTWTDTPEVFEDIKILYIKTKVGEEKFTLKSVKYQKNNIIAKFNEIDDINDAEKYKNTIIYADRSALGELEEGVYYIIDLIGMTIIDENCEKLGTLNDILQTGSNDVYCVKREGQRDLLLPVIDEVVLNIDMSKKEITVHVMEGLEDL